MTTTNNRVAQKNVTNVRLFVLFVLLMLSTTGVFGQNTTVAPVQVSVSTEATVVVSGENAVASASMDFAVWFVGATKTTNENNNTMTYSKKALINSGVRTNSVLIRSILKRISVQGNSIA